MKKLLFVLSFLACITSASAQLASQISDAKTYTDGNITTNGAGAVNGLKVNTALTKIINGLKYIDTCGKYQNAPPDSGVFATRSYVQSSVPTLQQVVAAGNTTTRNIEVNVNSPTSNGILVTNFNNGPSAHARLEVQSDADISLMAYSANHPTRMGSVGLISDDAFGPMYIATPFLSDIVMETGNGSNGRERMRIKDSGIVMINSLKSGRAAPATAGAVKQVVTDSNGQLSFRDIGVNGFSANFPTPVVGNSVDFYVPYGWTPIGYNIAGGIGETGSAVFGIKTATTRAGLSSGTSIVASAPPAITSANEVGSTTLTGWTASIPAGRWVRVSVTSVSGFTSLLFTLTVQKS